MFIFHNFHYNSDTMNKIFFSFWKQNAICSWFVWPMKDSQVAL